MAILWVEEWLFGWIGGVSVGVFEEALWVGGMFGCWKGWGGELRQLFVLIINKSKQTINFNDLLL